MWELEEALRRERGSLTVAGADEAGAGPLAGRVYAGAVILPFGLELPFLDDSKRVTPRRRDLLFDQIRERALAWSVAWVEPEEIDRMDILNSRIKAMDLAARGLAIPPDFLLVDGNRDHGSQWAISLPHRTVVGGDGLSANIAAASILAKVARDRYMEEMDALYPEYEFARHKGYGTKLHYECLRRYGPCPIHRLSFLKNL